MGFVGFWVFQNGLAGAKARFRSQTGVVVSFGGYFT